MFISPDVVFADGVELLCLIDRKLDACKYLITYGKWREAVWLAKTCLKDSECRNILCRWVEHLWNTHQKVCRCLLSVWYLYNFVSFICGHLIFYIFVKIQFRNFQSFCIEQFVKANNHSRLMFPSLLLREGNQSSCLNYCHWTYTAT